MRKGFSGKRYSIFRHCAEFTAGLLSGQCAPIYPRFSSYPKLIKPTPSPIFLSNSFKEEQLFLSFLFFFSFYFYTSQTSALHNFLDRERERERKFDRGRNSPLFAKREEKKGKIYCEVNIYIYIKKDKTKLVLKETGGGRSKKAGRYPSCDQV